MPLKPECSDSSPAVRTIRGAGLVGAVKIPFKATAIQIAHTKRDVQEIREHIGSVLTEVAAWEQAARDRIAGDQQPLAPTDLRPWRVSLEPLRVSNRSRGSSRGFVPPSKRRICEP